MKKMTCNQLGEACDTEFEADSWEQMQELSRKHGEEMGEKGDEAHLAAMDKMRELMQNPEDMQAWMESKRQQFEAL